jgi:transketolase
MIGIAAGLALSSKIVYAYAIVPFLCMRCFEQIRVDICSQNLPVNLVGSGGGLCYGPQGVTHHSIEDISIMRSLPNMTVVCPGDPVEAEMATQKSADWAHPIYIRLSIGRDPDVHTEKPAFEIGKGIILRDGSDLTLIATGNMLYTAKQVAERLQESNFNSRLISMHTIKPIDHSLIRKAATETGAIFTLEEHSAIGGLGSAVSEILAESMEKILFRKIALPDRYLNDVGGQEFLRRICGLSVDQVTETILDTISFH